MATGADGGTRTRTSRGKRILSPLRLPIPPRPHGLRLSQQWPRRASGARGHAARTGCDRSAGVEALADFLARLEMNHLFGGNGHRLSGTRVAARTRFARSH